MKFLRHIFTVGTTLLGGLHLQAQSFGLNYIAELQTDCQDGNMVNLLSLNGTVPCGSALSFDVSTISVAKTSAEPLVEDRQGFSNVEADNVALALSTAGFSWSFRSAHSLFVGVRNMNEDYFVSPATSFFTNSSCGICPTIGANYPIANYPVASVGVHYAYDPESLSAYASESLSLQVSIYNGMGHQHFTGHDNVFRFLPKDEGLFCLAEMKYSHVDTDVFLGGAVYAHHGVSVAPWLYAEHPLSNFVTLLAGYSHAFSPSATSLGESPDQCLDFVGVGAHAELPRVGMELGLFADFARYAAGREFATELSCLIGLAPHVDVRPTVHCIATHPSDAPADRDFHMVGTLRLEITF